MKDIELAFSRLEEGGLTLVLVKENVTIICDKGGILPLVELIDSGESLSGFSAADKVVGRAAALLYSMMKVACVRAEVMSEGAAEVLRSHGIEYSAKLIVPHIINRKGTGLCPMEEVTAKISDPTAALAAIKTKLKSLSR